MVAALDDDAHVVEQHARYAARRAKLRAALAVGAGFRIDHSEASLYLWAHPRRGLLGHRRLARRARHPGRARATSTARPARRHVRVAFTATDERVDAAVARLA